MVPSGWVACLRALETAGGAAGRPARGPPRAASRVPLPLAGGDRFEGRRGPDPAFRWRCEKPGRARAVPAV